VIDQEEEQMSRFKVICLAAIAGVACVSSARASIVFDDFDTASDGNGHFGYTPTFSSTTVGESTTAGDNAVTRVTSGTFSGTGGAMSMTAANDGSTTNLRIRLVSGNAPYNSANAGAPAANVSFTTSAGTDGYIGFIAKTTDTFTTSITLDGATGVAGEMTQGKPITMIADGDWHIYEWNLDDNTRWQAASGIGGVASVANSAHTIDSIYFFDGQAPAGTHKTVVFDEVVKSDSGSIASLVPEPSTVAVLGMSMIGLLRRRRNALH
jgi:hypothetical protein